MGRHRNFDKQLSNYQTMNPQWDYFNRKWKQLLSTVISSGVGLDNKVNIAMPSRIVCMFRSQLVEKGIYTTVFKWDLNLPKNKIKTIKQTSLYKKSDILSQKDSILLYKAFISSTALTSESIKRETKRQNKRGKGRSRVILFISPVVRGSEGESKSQSQ